MSDTLTTIQNVQVLVCAPDGEKLKSERDALDVISEAIQQGVSSFTPKIYNSALNHDIRFIF
jgi:hypothetical protein